MQVKAAKRIGRPMRKPVEGARYSLGLNVTGATKRRIDNAAKSSGRTRSQECEIRTEQTFHEEDLLPSIQQLAYGPGLADTVQEMVTAVRASRLEGRYLAEVRPQDMDSMWADPAFFEPVVNAIKGALDKM